MDVYLPLVDTQGNIIGLSEKNYAHQNALLHLAFSVFLFRVNEKEEIEFLFQQRSLKKYHCPGLWANSCCSHPKSYLSMLSDLQKRVQEELGLRIEQNTLVLLKSFYYKEQVSSEMFECEQDYFFVSPYLPHYSIDPNPEEVHAVKWVPFDSLEDFTSNNPCVPWLPYLLKLLGKKKFFIDLWKQQFSITSPCCRRDSFYQTR